MTIQFTAGTEKQTEWAATIAAAAFSFWNDRADHYAAAAAAAAAKSEKRSAFNAETARLIRAIADKAAECADATVWIDARGSEQRGPGSGFVAHGNRRSHRGRSRVAQHCSNHCNRNVSHYGARCSIIGG